METTVLPPPVALTAMSDTNAFVETAADIGRSLCRDAIWSGDRINGGRCNFLSSTNDPAFEQPKPYFKALEADFYAGSSGVGYFLAALYDATGDAVVRQTALGTLRNALTTARRIPTHATLGFFSGWTGIAYAAIRAGAWLNDDELSTEGRRLLDDVMRVDVGQTGLDVIDGAAGAIPALIRLANEDPSPTFRARVIQLADQLVTKAEQSARGWSWQTIPGANHPNLTGFAHGVAGMVNALLEAFMFTKNPVYQEAAFGGLRYENSYFDQQQQNWPDFRIGNPTDPYSADGAPAGPACSCAWCHGAPGIALSRLRGYELTQHPSLKNEATTAVQTTASQLTWGSQANFSLCHGLAGNADVLLEAADVLQTPDWYQQAEEVGRIGQEQYKKTGLWANGLYNGYQLPDFMLGLSGTGYFYLRLAKPATYRSVLLLR